jgi:hypothetical protein
LQSGKNENYARENRKSRAETSAASHHLTSKIYDYQGRHVEDEATLPGSITSFDEEVKFERERSPANYDPTRLTRIFNPEPYKGWDALLTELKASGRILRDSESTSETPRESLTTKT